MNDRHCGARNALLLNGLLQEHIQHVQARAIHLPDADPRAHETGTTSEDSSMQALLTDLAGGQGQVVAGTDELARQPTEEAEGQSPSTGFPLAERDSPCELPNAPQDARVGPDMRDMVRIHQGDEYMDVQQGAHA